MREKEKRKDRMREKRRGKIQDKGKREEEG
jgi:hypothetical protein